jgi:UDP-N-acetyl-D-glucosamine dehydrogenase
MLRFAQVGFKVIGFDIDGKKIASLNSGQSYIKYIPKKEYSGCAREWFRGDE